MLSNFLRLFSFISILNAALVHYSYIKYFKVNALTLIFAVLNNERLFMQQKAGLILYR